ncbi:MAG TPA: DUF4342 domain-containing protein [Tissierellia bacterium]|jgi:NACalpha-BTF3-like transcription factor|nr:DUF4342 domain-containing protein [Tissierellia bacterium]
MSENLQKIDEILKRTNTDYATAKEALEVTGGDILEAIIWIENQQKKNTGSAKGEQLMNQLKEILSKGNATKLTIKKNNEVIVNLPITAGLIGALVAPFLSAAGITAALLTQCTVEITQADGRVIDLGKKVDEQMSGVKETVQDVVEDVKKEAKEIKDDLASTFKNNTEM